MVINKVIYERRLRRRAASIAMSSVGYLREFVNERPTAAAAAGEIVLKASMVTGI